MAWVETSYLLDPFVDSPFSERLQKRGDERGQIRNQTTPFEMEITADEFYIVLHGSTKILAEGHSRPFVAMAGLDGPPKSLKFRISETPKS